MRRPRFLSNNDDFVPIEEQKSFNTGDVATGEGESPDRRTPKYKDSYSDDPSQPSGSSGQTFELSGIRKTSLNLSHAKGIAAHRETSADAKAYDKGLPVPADTADRPDPLYDRSVSKIDAGKSARTYAMRSTKNINKDESAPSDEKAVTFAQNDTTDFAQSDNETITKTKKRKNYPDSSDKKIALGTKSDKGDQKNKSSKKRKNRIVSLILALLAILCFALGIYFLVLPSIVHKNQDDAAKKLLEKLKEQEKSGDVGEVEITVKAGEVNAPGSFSPEYDVILQPGETLNPDSPAFTEEKFDRDAIIKIKTDTIMRIPKIDLEIAVAPNVRSSSLWVLPGHYPSSVKPGQKGVAAYFGHRMYGKGRHFNRLNEVEKGDIIEVQRKGKIYTYLVDAQRIIEPADLGKYVLEKTSKAKILLVTCHPIQTTGTPKYRIVVQGHLTDVRDVE